MKNTRTRIYYNIIYYYFFMLLICNYIIYILLNVCSIRLIICGLLIYLLFYWYINIFPPDNSNIRLLFTRDACIFIVNLKYDVLEQYFNLYFVFNFSNVKCFFLPKIYTTHNNCLKKIYTVYYIIKSAIMICFWNLCLVHNASLIYLISYFFDYIKCFDFFLLAGNRELISNIHTHI
jgi:hypothetical protein